MTFVEECNMKISCRQLYLLYICTFPYDGGHTLRSIESDVEKHA
jgi:hypothetical protein